MAKETQKPEETKETNKHLPILANGRGLALRNMDDMWRFACAVKESGLAPASFTRPEQILIAIQSGAELGLPPMRSLQSFCVVHGNARLWGDTPLALVMQSGNLEYIKEWIEGDIGKDLSKTDNEVKAVCETKRKGHPEPIKSEFSVFDAKRAGLWNQKTLKGNNTVWMNYPKRMLQMRARSVNLRDNFPDAFGGASIAEEFEGLPEPEYDATTPKREDRRPTTAYDIQANLGECLEVFVNKSGLLPVVAIPHFADFAAFTLGGEKDAFLRDDVIDALAFDEESIEKLKAALQNDLPEVITEKFPTPDERQLEDYFDEQMKERKYKCLDCGVAFDNPKGAKKNCCAECLSQNIEKVDA